MSYRLQSILKFMLRFMYIRFSWWLTPLLLNNGDSFAKIPILHTTLKPAGREKERTVVLFPAAFFTIRAVCTHVQCVQVCVQCTVTMPGNVASNQSRADCALPRSSELV